MKLVLFFMLGALAVSGADAKADFARLAKAIEVKELNTLMFAKSSDVNLAKVETFLKEHPKAAEREQALYLRAYMKWSLHRYANAAPAYAALLKEFPKTRFLRIALIREAAAHLFSGRGILPCPACGQLSWIISTVRKCLPAKWRTRCRSRGSRKRHSRSWIAWNFK